MFICMPAASFRPDSNPDILSCAIKVLAMPADAASNMTQLLTMFCLDLMNLKLTICLLA